MVKRAGREEFMQKEKRIEEYDRTKGELKKRQKEEDELNRVKKGNRKTYL